MPQLKRLTIRGYKSIRALEGFELRGLRDCIKTKYLICMTVEPASSRLKPAGSRFYIKFFLKINRRFFDSL